ncbi:collagen triple helix repeat-containing protein 1-like [Clytia hemisphaerica]
MTKFILCMILCIAVNRFAFGDVCKSSGHCCNNGCTIQNFCQNGKDGKDGRSGRNGVDGIDGRDGQNGQNGVNGLNGRNGVDAVRNWKECAWNNIDDKRQSGVIKECSFKKNSKETYLKFQVTGNLRNHNCAGCCKRWYITLDGGECSPVPIDGIVYISHAAVPLQHDLHQVRTFSGHCQINRTGTVKVALSIGDCAGVKGGHGMTGWKSSTRIYVEEIEAPQK